MKKNGNNIIFDDDVTMTGVNTGKTLSDTLGSVFSKVNKLESNLKWIYSHGGVGGGTRGNSSTGSSTYSLYATLDGVQLTGQTLKLGQDAEHILAFKIQNPNGATYSVIYSYSTINSSGVLVDIEQQVTLDISNNYAFSKLITLNNNDTIVITSTDSVYNTTKQASCPYITETYSIGASLVSDDGGVLGSEIFVTDASNKGLDLKLDYEFAVSDAKLITYAVLNTGIKLITSETKTQDFSVDNKQGSLIYNIVELGLTEGWEPKEENSGLYTATIYTRVEIEGSKAVEKNYPFSFTLIPDNLYLLIQNEGGEIYQGSDNITEPSLENPYEFLVGTIELSTRAYLSDRQSLPCTISYYVGNDGSNLSTINTSLREKSTLSIYLSDPGWNKINFRLECDNVFYPSTGFITYWIYTKYPDNNVDWPTIDKKTTGDYIINRVNSSGGSGDIFNFYRLDKWGGTEIDGVVPFTQISEKTKNSPLVMTSTRDRFSVTDIQSPKTSGESRNTVLCLGFKYNNINEDNALIFTGERFINLSYTEVISIYQNKICIGGRNNGDILEYYFPKTHYEDFKDETQYHLLMLVSRFIKTENNTDYYEVIVYVDGRIEGVLQNYTKESLSFDRVNFEPSNCTFNLIEIDYLSTIFKTELKNGIVVPTDVSVSEDMLAYQYYLKYISAFLSYEISEEERGLLALCSNFELINKGDVVCDNSSIQDIASNLKVPTLIFTIIDDGSDIPLKTQLDSSYSENDPVPIWETSISWANGNGEKPVRINPVDSGLSDGRFTLEIQGSSTRSYKCKNFTLSIKNGSGNDEEAPIYLFSPNFDPMDSSTFLPEQSFTLKADVVDSSHSNNTSIGKFVNYVSEKFDTGPKNALSGYIRNCLEGFPIVVYINIHETFKNGLDPIDTYYYQGVYNFNLGRESFYNLGYKDSGLFLDDNGNINLNSAGTGFSFYQIDRDSDSFKYGLIVSEIQGNSPFFDFSQYDQSILFPNLPVANEPYMFGDLVTGGEGMGDAAKPIISNFVQKVSKAGGYLFQDVLKKRMSDDFDGDLCGYSQGYSAFGEITRPKYEVDIDTGSYLVDEFGKKIPVLDEQGNPVVEEVSVPLNQVPNYKKHFKKKLSGSEIVYYIDSDTVELPGTEGNLAELILIDDEGVQPWLDYQSLSEYYTICMAFGLIDSVQKNMNIKSWTGNKEERKAKFYTAFYDMDTCLGINNMGTDVSYFAFSDYWDYSESGDSSIVKPGPVTIYRDYTPPAGSNDSLSSSDFYDTPSSYLFAVAKYSVMSGRAGSGRVETANWPKELWAKWRMWDTETDSLGDTTDPTIGCLRSAKYFIDNFFANNLNSVGAPLVNLNYRNKYLVVNERGTGFDITNFQKFNGSRVSKAEDWLEGRFRILDAYFNLTKSTNVIQYYDEDNIYTNLMSGEAYISEPDFSSNYSLSKNSDITILQDIFADTGKTEQGSSPLDLTIKSKEYSPMVLTTANASYRYLLEGGEDLMYNVKLAIYGLQTFNLFGSSSWTYLNNINSFSFDNLQINSKYLSTLNGSGTRKLTIDGEKIILPSLKSLSLTGNYYGGFTGESGEISTRRFPNLDSINISNNSLSATINESNCTEIYIKNKTGGNVSITGCSQLVTLDLGEGAPGTPATTLNQLVLKPVPNNTCNINTTSNNNQGGYCLDYCEITNLTLTNLTPTDEVGEGIRGSRISITNSEKLTTLSLKGFAQVYINNCPNLISISITEPEGVKDEEGNDIYSGDRLQKLYIKTCGNTGTDNLGINISHLNGGAGICYLEEYTELVDVTIQDCSKVKEINLPTDHDINLLSSAFESNTSLMYVSGGSETSHIYVKGDRIFRNCPKFLLTDKNGIQTNLIVHESTTSISNMFNSNNGSLTFEVVKEFLKRIPAVNSITNISALFANQRFHYTEEDLLEALTSGSDNYLDMTRFRKVTNASSCFAWCSYLRAIHPKMLEFGQDVSGISFSYFFHPGLVDVTTTLDVFRHIINKIDCLWHTDWGHDGVPRLRFVTNDGSKFLTNVSLNAFFHPAGKHPTRVRYLTTFGVDISNEEVTYDWSNVFNSTWSSLLGIRRFLFDKEYGDEQLNLSKLFFNYPPKLVYAIEVLRVKLTKPVNLYTLFDWDQLVKSTYCFFDHRKDTQSDYEIGSFQINKYITISKFQELCNKLVIGSNLVGLDNIFRNCTILQEDGSDLPVILSNNYTNTKIRTISSLFKDTRLVAVNSPVDIDPELHPEGEISDQILDELPNLPDCYFNFSEVLKYLPNLIAACYSFSGTYQSESIPFNFFNKRVVKKERSVYLRKDGFDEVGNSFFYDDYYEQFETANLYSYSYNKSFTKLYGCFSNVVWKRDDDQGINSRRFNGTVINNGETIDQDVINSIESDYILKQDGTKLHDTTGEGVEYFLKKEHLDEMEFVLDDDGNIKDYIHKYYFETDSNSRLYLSRNTEITDLTDFIKAGDSGKYTAGFNATVGKDYVNFDVAESSRDKLFCPPDIFYGCSSNCGINNFFDNSNNIEDTLEGTIPSNLLKACKSTSITNVFRNLNILPRLLWREGDEEDDNATLIRDIYFYIPTNFTTCSNLSYSFNFHLMLPSIGNNTVTATGKTRYNVDAYYIFLKDSISSNTSSLFESLPNVAKGLYEGDTQGQWTTGSGGKTYSFDPIHYGIMYEGETINISGRLVNQGKDGLNMDKLSNLRVDHLIQPNLAGILYGRLFSSNFYLENVSRTNVSRYIIDVPIYHETAYISSNLIFPSTSAGSNFYNRSIINFNSNNGHLYINKTQLENFGESGIITAYETINCGATQTVDIVPN